MIKTFLRASLVLMALMLSLPSANAAILGILADPSIDYPPFSTTGYALNSLADALYQLGDGQTLNQIQIDGLNYLAVDDDNVMINCHESTNVMINYHDSTSDDPHVDQLPSPHQYHQEPVTPEPQSWILMLAGIGLMWRPIKRLV